MSRVLDHLQAAVLERAGESGSVGGRHDAVAFAPDDEGRDPDPCKSAYQLGVVHLAGDDAHRRHVAFRASGLLGRHGRGVDVETIGVVPGVLRDASCVEGEEVADGVSVDVDADGIDEDETADPAGAVTHRHFGADPATHRGADDEDVAQVPVIEVMKVGQGEIIYTGEPVGTIRPIPPRVGRDDRVHRFGQVTGDAGDGERTAAAVEDQDRPSRARLGDGDLEVRAERDCIGQWSCHVRILSQHVDICNLTQLYAPVMPANLETLGRAVKQVQYRHHRALDTRLAAVHTTLAQWDALRAIDRNPGASAHTLAIETFQSDQSFGTLANRLAAQALISRRAGRGP